MLSSLSIAGKPKPAIAYNALKALAGDAILSQANVKISASDYAALWEKFKEDFSALQGLPYSEFMPALISLLEQYWCCIPSSAGEDQDISLFQNAKTTAAFAAALYAYHTEEKTMDEAAVNDDTTKKFLLVSGDMSGIQKYIFDLKNPTNNAKLLRARSFQLWALSEIAAEYITKQCGLPASNVITSVGGKFLLLLPNTDSTKKLLAKLQEKLESYFLQEFAGGLSFVLSDGVEAASSEMTAGHLSDVLNKVGYVSEACKQRKMQKALTKHGHVFNDLYAALQKNGECEFCQIFPAAKSEDSKKICCHCADLVKIGEKLVKANKIILKTEALKEDAPFAELIEIKTKDEPSFGFVINQFRPGYPLIYLPYVAPKDTSDKLLTFEDIAKKSTGTKKLAMFKADIDNLGLLFASSLGTKISLPRYAELSRILHYFFSACYADFVERKYKDELYTVFSGGDDLCVLGPWNTIMDFASDFREEIRKLTNNNPSITLSGGIALASPSLPVRNIAEGAEAQLECSKHFTNAGNGLVKDAITVFDTTMSWSEYTEYVAAGKKLVKYIEEKKLTTGPVYKMLCFANRAKNVRNGNVLDMVWISNFRYMIARVIKTPEVKELFLQLGEPAAIEKARAAICYALYAGRTS